MVQCSELPKKPNTSQRQQLALRSSIPIIGSMQLHCLSVSFASCQMIKRSMNAEFAIVLGLRPCTERMPGPHPRGKTSKFGPGQMVSRHFVKNPKVWLFAPGSL